ncbi:hypothetical protein EV356DRAFT_501564 [Viridothelium virens]|uniref:Uncharacterized protein n=1 Tax=Viridothelium virens TaxID=1048519 RepID=A0A6A6HAX6_VIRVR|nr:hypothetical protein EV356DRAFT_501564 [Viridothelium virens]
MCTLPQFTREHRPASSVDRLITQDGSAESASVNENRHGNPFRSAAVLAPVPPHRPLGTMIGVHPGNTRLSAQGLGGESHLTSVTPSQRGPPRLSCAQPIPSITGGVGFNPHPSYIQLHLLRHFTLYGSDLPTRSVSREQGVVGEKPRNHDVGPSTGSVVQLEERCFTSDDQRSKPERDGGGGGEVGDPD